MQLKNAVFVRRGKIINKQRRMNTEKEITFKSTVCTLLGIVEDGNEKILYNRYSNGSH